MAEVIMKCFEAYGARSRLSLQVHHPEFQSRTGLPGELPPPLGLGSRGNPAIPTAGSMTTPSQV